MNENITPEVEEVESQIEGAEAEVEADEDGWPTEWTDAAEESDDNEGETVEEEPKADQPTEKPKAEETKDADKPTETEPEQKAEEEDQFLELKHMDEVRKVSREEAKTLAQKGLDYDRIRGERDAMQKDYAQLKKYENFLNEMKGDFPSIDAMMTDTRARMLAEKEGISYADAVAKAKLMHQEAKPEEAKREDQPQRQDAVQRFVQLYPGVKAEEIPQSVWDEVKRTGDLVGAYRGYERQKQADRIASLENEIATLKQNQKNAARSPGSMNSSGKTSAKSLEEKLWEEDDD